MGFWTEHEKEKWEERAAVTVIAHEDIGGV